MFSFNFALISVLILSIYGQNLRLKPFSPNQIKNTGFFGELQNLIDQSNQQSLESSQDLSDGRQDELTFISCDRIRPNIKNAYPTDKTKYFICRKDQTPEIYTCPNGGIFDNTEKACIDLCQQNNPCLNQGQCIILPDLRLECVCRRDWTGERCEIPKSSCANNPCGVNNECRMLITPDYGQDYVCICDKHQTYGKNCQRTVPNPCLTNQQQFHPFAFSRHAYINCDDELIFFQPCNSHLYWNQEEKRCDRSLPEILRLPFLNIKVQNNQRDSFSFGRPGSIRRPTQFNDDNKDELIVVTLEKPLTIQVSEWQGIKMPMNQQQMNMGSQKWGTQNPAMQKPTDQRFVFPSQNFRPQIPSIPGKSFMQPITTTTMPTKTFRLEGFGKKNTGEQQPMNENIMMNQPLRPDSMQQTVFEPTTTTPKPVVHSLIGWKSNPQETPSTFQARSWRS